MQFEFSHASVILGQNNAAATLAESSKEVIAGDPHLGV